MLTQNHFDFYGTDLKEKNQTIAFNGNEKDTRILATVYVQDWHFTGDTKSFPLYRYDSEGNRHDNITDWGLAQFQQHYGKLETEGSGTLPPSVQSILRAIADESSTLPVLQKHSEQLGSQLASLSDYSAVTLAPIRETLQAFASTLVQRKRDAVERKTLYQRLQSHLSELQTQLEVLAPSSRRAPDISKLDIFHYTYGVLHDPAHRKKYALNLKREFPRLPYYADFWQWADWGQALMELHLHYETAEPFGLKRVDKHIGVKGSDQPALFESAEPPPVSQTKGKLKVKLKAKQEEGVIDLDEQTSLHGVPPEAWEYKLGNRSALEWVLDQYKEKKPRDQTIAEKFNTYRFADYKEHVIDLLQRVTTVSVATRRIIRAMESEG